MHTEYTALPQSSFMPLEATAEYKKCRSLIETMKTRQNQWERCSRLRLGDIGTIQRTVDEYLAFIDALRECQKVAVVEYNAMKQQLSKLNQLDSVHTIEKIRLCRQ